MAAYAALVSIMQIIHEIEHHPFPPISMDKKQVESLTEIITFLQEFLEGYKSPVVGSDEADKLEMRIADTVYAAKDVIESHTVDQILKVVSADFCASLLKVINDGNLMFKKDVTQLDAVKDRLQTQVLESVDSSTSAELYESLVKVIENMDLIKKEVMEIVAVDPLQRQVSASTSVAASSTSNNSLASSPSRPESTIMLGFDDVMLQLMEKLIYGRLGRQVIPIVGMGGIGKTTLATNVYKKIVDSYHFDICAWVTISQEYNTKELLCEILSQANKEGKERLSQMREDEVGVSLHKCLTCRRYLVVLDDMWSIEAWEKLQRYFPDNSNGSRIMVTTRLSNLWSPSDNSYGIEMKFMDEESSWNIFCKIVFGGRISCPLELEKIGKEIVKSCRGLPLSIVVIGGILEKLERTNECWKSVRRSLNSLVNSENDKHCLKILKLSYNHLPVYLKPCFLYMGMFKEDSKIHVSKVIKLWVSEGFLKPVSGKSLETLAKEYLSELVDRNLLLVHEFGKTGNMKYLKMHDLLRDLCLREAEKERFYHVVGQHSLPQGTYVKKRVFVPRCTSMEKVLHAMKWTLRAYDEELQNLGQNGCSYWEWETHELLENLCLREAEKETFYDAVGQHCRQGTYSQRHVFTTGSTSKEKYFDAMEWTLRASGDNFYRRDKDFHRIMFELDNLRLLVVYSQGLVHNQLPSSVNLFWSLQTLIVHCHYDGNVRAPVEIWNMPQLRHVHFMETSMGRR
ncbi:putative late blight resistance protein homolog R1A-10 [Salvia hispanica]|uniref:putative late blight resistance protein homolog R1A-10 n=1 Tax=Salvia hispanica TaxID=49212 RepID=UPI0020095F35|nr:putative late blight resistance protein homolog R1A-10 [Salvia hispanica]